MEAKMFGGSAWGVPVRGGMINLSNADTNMIISAASGLASFLFKAGGGLVLAGLIGGAFLLLRSREEEVFSLNTMAKIESASKNFNGVCVDEQLEISCDDERVVLSVGYINKIWNGDNKGYYGDWVQLFDGSTYRIDDVRNNGKICLRFLSPVGIQKVSITGAHNSIVGHTVQQKDELVKNMSSFLEARAKDSAKIIGENNFKRFFSKI